MLRLLGPSDRVVVHRPASVAPTAADTSSLPHEDESWSLDATGKPSKPPSGLDYNCLRLASLLKRQPLAVS